MRMMLTPTHPQSQGGAWRPRLRRVHQQRVRPGRARYDAVEVEHAQAREREVACGRHVRQRRADQQLRGHLAARACMDCLRARAPSI